MNPTQPPGPVPNPVVPPIPPAPQAVYVSRPIDPEKPVISPETLQKHEASKKKYPQLNLTNGEYVLSAVGRHPIGLLQIWGISGFLIAIIIAAITLLANSDSTTAGGGSSFLPLLTLPLLLVAAVVLVGGAVGTYIYQANNFFLTNESVIQNVQTGLFHKRLQTVSLGNIEDASFTQSGILSHIFNYGSIRLSTEGDETTYRFNYASNPEKQVAQLNNAVEDFKNGRPVEGHYS